MRKQICRLSALVAALAVVPGLRAAGLSPVRSVILERGFEPTRLGEVLPATAALTPALEAAKDALGSGPLVAAYDSKHLALISMAGAGQALVASLTPQAEVRRAELAGPVAQRLSEFSAGKDEAAKQRALRALFDAVRVDADLSDLRSMRGFRGYEVSQGRPGHPTSYMREPHVLVTFRHPADLMNGPGHVLHEAGGLPVVYDYVSQEGVVTVTATVEKKPRRSRAAKPRR